MRPAVLVISSSLAAGSSPAVSHEAAFIEQEAREVWEFSVFPLATTGYTELFSDLDQLLDECSSPGWDGYDAAPLDPQAIDHAKRFLRCLPPGMDLPDIGAEPDGQLALEWYVSPNRMLSVSIAPEGNLHYAARIGADRQFGTAAFLGHVPRTLLELIRRVSQR